MFTKAYWLDVAERAVRTFAQTLVTVWGAGQFNLLEVDWAQSLGVAGGTAVLSVLNSIGWPARGQRGLDPSFVDGVRTSEMPPADGDPEPGRYIGKRRKDES